MLRGILSTNASWLKALCYGNKRNLCLGIEVVIPSGGIIDLTFKLHKDGSRYDLRHLITGAEGALGIITVAVLKLVP